MESGANPSRQGHASGFYAPGRKSSPPPRTTRRPWATTEVAILVRSLRRCGREASAAWRVRAGSEDQAIGCLGSCSSGLERETTQDNVRGLYGDPAKTSFTLSGNEIWEYDFFRMHSRPTNVIPYVSLIHSGAEGDKKSCWIVEIFTRGPEAIPRRSPA